MTSLAAVPQWIMLCEHTREHALIDNAVACEQQAVTGKLGQVRVAELVDIARNEIGGRNVCPYACISSRSLSSWLRCCLQNPFRSTRTSHSKREISRSRFIVFRSQIHTPVSVGRRVGTYCSSFNERRRYASNRHGKDADGVVVV